MLHENLRLFARKFDPKDTEVFEVLDHIRAGGQPWRKGPTFNFVAIRSLARWGGPKGEVKLCLSLEATGGKGQPPSKRVMSRSEAFLAKCSNDDPHQIFKLGPCSKLIGERGVRVWVWYRRRERYSERVESCAWWKWKTKTRGNLVIYIKCLGYAGT